MSNLLIDYSKPTMAFKELSMPADGGMATLTLAVSGEGVSIDCTIDITPDDAMKIRNAFLAWTKTTETLKSNHLEREPT